MRAGAPELPGETGDTMSRKAAPAIDEASDLHGFWDGPSVELDDLDEAFVIIDADDSDHDVERETLVYMGSVSRSQVDDDELTVLADWAEAKACPSCRTFDEQHPRAKLQHDGCATALRVGRLLRTYG
jgi:hypothetical protein